MYQYDEHDQNLVEQRSREFRLQVERRLQGKISEEEFKPIRLMNGLYLQLHAYMLRVAIPYGVLSAVQMRTLADVSDRYDRGYGHFTTRQNIQFNWPKLDETPDLLDDLAGSGMHAIQTSGNCIRNITTDPLAGVAADEEVDPRPLCELLRQWSTLHPEFAYLPRKFKLAVTGSANDRAAIKVHDIGLRLKRDSLGNELIDVWVGGGQGRTPKVAQLFRENVPLQELLPYLEAVMRVYNRYGRRDNKYKARIKILLSETGLEQLQEKVADEFSTIDRAPFAAIAEQLEFIRGRFVNIDFDQADASIKGNVDANVEAAETGQQTQNNPHYQRWLLRNVKKHKQAGYAIAMISLKPTGGIPGDATSTQMRVVADLAERYSHGEIRVTHRQNLVLAHVRQNDLYLLWQALGESGLAESNIDLPSDIIACPGMDYCSLATARTIPLAQQISSRISKFEKDTDVGNLSVNISGCINACAHHHVADIGVLGLDRAGSENYQITLGGRNDLDTRIGKRVGPGIASEQVPAAVERVINLYLERRDPHEAFGDTCVRLGNKPFAEVVYASD